MRHATSERTDHLMKDFDRPLAKNGRLEPVFIAEQLNKLQIIFEKVLVSPSKRTQETWEALIGHLHLPPSPLLVPSLYEASLEDFIESISFHAEDTNTLLVIAHCPAVNEAIQFFSGEYHDFKPAELALLKGNNDTLMDCLDKPKSFTLEKILSVK